MHQAWGEEETMLNLKEEACAKDMGQRSTRNDALLKGARVLLETEGSVLNLVQRKKSYAVAIDAQVKLKSEVCVGDMGRGSFAALKDARAILEQEESVTCMQRSNDRGYDYENGFYMYINNCLIPSSPLQ